MRQTIVGVFDRQEAARRAASLLAESGFGPDSVQTTDEIAADADDPGHDGATPPSALRGEGPLAKVRSFFAEVFGSAGDGDRGDAALDRYADTLRRGGAVVRVEAEAGERLDLARRTLASAGAVDIEETQVADEAERGWSRSEAVAATAAGGASAASAVAAALTGVQGAMPIVPPTPRESGPDGGQGGEMSSALRPGAAAADRDFASREDELRGDYRDRYALLDTSYEEYEPHYRYGHVLRGDERYRGTSWDDLEPQARADWERRYPGSNWERFKEAVRSGWHRLDE